MTFNYEYTEITGRRKWKCDVCGKCDIWGPDWTSFSSIALEDASPNDIPTSCSDKCLEEMQSNIKSGKWKLPTLSRNTYAGCTVVTERKGY